jgi:hypothetical protein
VESDFHKGASLRVSNTAVNVFSPASLNRYNSKCSHIFHPIYI